MLKRPILLSELKSHFLQPNNELNHIALFKQSRLSVSPLTDAEFQFIMSLESVAQTASPSKKVSQANKRRKL
jgi:predicted RNA-binding protein with PUA-like domain